MKHPLSRVLVMVAVSALAGIALVGPSSADVPDEVGMERAGPVHKAELIGAEEVPGPGDHDGKGFFSVESAHGHDSLVCYHLTVSHIAPATAAHIHRGRMGEAGPIVVTLQTPIGYDQSQTSESCSPIDVKTANELRHHPRHFYVNVHNEEYPDGAIRGQLH